MREVVLVDENDRELGVAEIYEAHRNPAKLHRAISILLFNSRGEMLITKRAPEKFTWPGYWTNSVCANVFPGESYNDCADRRLKEELGISTGLIEKFSFIYSAVYDEQYGENEIDHVFTGIYDGKFKPDPKELSDHKWVGIEELRADMAKHPEIYTPWFKIIINDYSDVLS